jgi:hypothetical protein
MLPSSSFPRKAISYGVDSMINRCDGMLHVVEDDPSKEPLVNLLSKHFRCDAPSWNISSFRGLEFGYDNLLERSFAYRAIRIFRGPAGGVVCEPFEGYDLSSEVNAQIPSHPFFQRLFGKEAILKTDHVFHINAHHFTCYENSADMTTLTELSSFDFSRPQVVLEVAKTGFETNPSILMDHILSVRAINQWEPMISADIFGNPSILTKYLLKSCVSIFEKLQATGHEEFKLKCGKKDFACCVFKKAGLKINGYILFFDNESKKGPKIFDFQTKSFLKAVHFVHPEAFDALEEVYKRHPLCNLFSAKYTLTLENGEKFYAFENSGWKHVDELMTHLMSLEAVLQFKHLDKIFLECMRATCSLGAGGYRIPNLSLQHLYFLQGPNPVNLPLKIFAKRLEQNLDFRDSIRELLGIAYNIYIKYACLGVADFFTPAMTHTPTFLDHLKAQMIEHEAAWKMPLLAAPVVVGSGPASSVASAAEAPVDEIAPGQDFVFRMQGGLRNQIFTELLDIHDKVTAIFSDAAFADKTFLKLADLKKPIEEDATLPPQVAALKVQYSRFYRLFMMLDSNYQETYFKKGK